MGEAAEAILDGECCQFCGEWFHDEAPGHPRSCGCDGGGSGRSAGKRRREKERKKRRAAERKARLKATPVDGWKRHTLYHWSREFQGKMLHYWPSTGRFQYDEGIFEGDPVKFMKDHP